MSESEEIDRYRAQLRATLGEFEGVEGFSKEAFIKARELFQIRRFDKGEALLSAAGPGRFVFFLCKGLVRLFYETESGKQFNKSFAWENMFVAGSLNPTGPEGSAGNEYGIEALEPVTTLAISLNDFGRLLATAPEWHGFRDAYIRWLAERKARRERQLLLESAEERYRRFLVDFPETVARIPQYHIALYLGITDVALSRIRKRAGL